MLPPFVGAVVSCQLSDPTPHPTPTNSQSTLYRIDSPSPCSLPSRERRKYKKRHFKEQDDTSPYARKILNVIVLAKGTFYFLGELIHS